MTTHTNDDDDERVIHDGESRPKPSDAWCRRRPRLRGTPGRRRRPRDPLLLAPRERTTEYGYSQELCLSKSLVALCVLLGYAGVALAQEDRFKPASVVQTRSPVTSLTTSMNWTAPSRSPERDECATQQTSSSRANWRAAKEEASSQGVALHGCPVQRVMAYKDATDNATRPDLYEQLHIMVEVWDVGVQKGDGLLSMSVDEKPYVS